MGQSWDQSLDNGMRAGVQPGLHHHDRFRRAFDKKDVLDLIDLMRRLPRTGVRVPGPDEAATAYPLLFQPDADYSGEITMGRFAPLRSDGHSRGGDPATCRARGSGRSCHLKATSTAVPL